jgi:hypothetical protein
MTPSTHPLLGEWTIDGSDAVGVARYGHVSMRFQPDGTLEYTIHGEEVDQKMFLTYQILGNVLITDQPSRPNPVRSEFAFDDRCRLVLLHNGVHSFYLRRNISETRLGSA